MTQRAKQEQTTGRAFKEAIENGKRIRAGLPTRAAEIKSIKNELAQIETRLNAIPTKPAKVITIKPATKAVAKAKTKLATPPARAFKMVTKASTSTHAMKR